MKKYKFTYVGKVPVKVPGVGEVKKDKEFDVTDKELANSLIHDPNFKADKETVVMLGKKKKKVKKQGGK